ncbi:thiamine phosphate synthase [Paenibacillus sp. UNC451MF]|uniref:thiamine phosphate synthase n=1 Tax=Paenibacillus sp. UNC451MF TaxID=1449063 RepID=UPI00048F5698|nr:thiamine phosphate synthase [Paenibacillus sp. UNC451MF]
MRKHALHVMTTGKQTVSEVADILRHCPTEGIDVLHIREKTSSAREITEWYTQLKPLLQASEVYINDRLDAALAVQAQGVQLAYNSLSLNDSRRILPATVRIGCSVHSVEEAVQAAGQGADYVLFGHIYESNSKPGLAPRGVKVLAEVVAACTIPVIAIGGIEPDNVGEVLSTGCAGVAMLSSVLLHSDPAAQILRFREAIDRTHHIPRSGFH